MTRIVMATSIKKLDEPMKSINVETRIALVEQTNEHIYSILSRIEKRFDEVDYRFDKLDKKIEESEQKIESKLDKMNQTIDSINNRLWTNFYWILATLF